MICAACKTGGSINAEALAMVRSSGANLHARDPEMDLDLLELTVDRARREHELCPAGTWCDCQHQTLILPWEPAGLGRLPV